MRTAQIKAKLIMVVLASLPFVVAPVDPAVQGTDPQPEGKTSPTMQLK